MNNDTLAVFDATVQNFTETVIDRSRQVPVLVDFWADWCPPCKALEPVLYRVLEEYAGRVTLGKVEVDDNMKLAGQYGLRGFPTVLLFVDGAEVGRFSGAQPAAEVRGFLDQHLP